MTSLAPPGETTTTTQSPMWKPILQRALQRNRSQAQARYLQLATITPAGLPACRTVVFRGFLHNTTDHLTAITDARSTKMHDFAANHHAAIAWYLPKTREQFRFTTRVLPVGPSGPLHTEWSPQGAGDTAALCAARTQLWAGLSDKARAQFLWPHPGLVRTEKEEAWDDALLAPDAALPCTVYCSTLEYDVVSCCFTSALTLCVYVLLLDTSQHMLNTHLL